jgi:hypothetical protein
MKKPCFITLFLLLSFLLFAQTRTNVELPIITETGKRLVDITGWSLSPDGQWVSRKNRIPVRLEAKSVSLIDRHEWGLGIDTINKLTLYNVAYKNKEYFLLEKAIIDGRYRYPNIREGWINLEKRYYYIIEKDNFIFRLVKNNKCTNRIAVYNYTDDSSIEQVSLCKLSSIIEPHIRDSNSNNEHNAFNRIERVNYIDIFTFYFTDENTVRFFFNNGFSSRINGRDSLSVMPDDYYFECSFEHFVNFFAPVIEELP